MLTSASSLLDISVIHNSRQSSSLFTRGSCDVGDVDRSRSLTRKKPSVPQQELGQRPILVQGI